MAAQCREERWRPGAPGPRSAVRNVQRGSPGLSGERSRLDAEAMKAVATHGRRNAAPSHGVSGPVRLGGQPKGHRPPSAGRLRPVLSVAKRPTEVADAPRAEAQVVERGKAAARDRQTRGGGATDSYQIWARSLSGRTIGSPGLQLNASAKAGMFDSGPIVRNCGGACGSTVTSSRVNSGRDFARQI
jgi:hypothetical protein